MACGSVAQDSGARWSPDFFRLSPPHMPVLARRCLDFAGFDAFDVAILSAGRPVPSGVFSEGLKTMA